MPRYQPGNWPRLAIGGLVTINAVLLLALFVRQPTLAIPASDQLDSPSVTSSPRASSVDVPTANPSLPPRPDPEQTPRAERLMAVGSQRLGWRATVGTCRQQSSMEVTTDGGRTWRTVRPGVSALVRLKSYQQRSVFAIGADDECRPIYAWTSSAKNGWQRSASLANDIWFRVPSNPDRVHAPGGQLSNPCATGLSDLAGLGTYQAAALCRDGRIRTTDNGGRWRTVMKSSGGRAVNADDREFVIARVTATCTGVLIQRFDVYGRGLDSADSTCQHQAPTSAPMAVAITPTATWLWSGPETMVF